MMGNVSRSLGKARRMSAKVIKPGTRTHRAMYGTAGSMGRRARGIGLGVGAGALGANAVVGPRYRSSGRNGIRGNSVGGGRPF